MAKTIQQKARAKELGSLGEDHAARFLSEKKMRILARNWRPQGIHQGFELDIVAEHHGTIVFVEVKTRSSEEKIAAYTAFSWQKRQKMIKAAHLYLHHTNTWDKPCRFDLVCVCGSTLQTFSVQHYEHVIEFG